MFEDICRTLTKLRYAALAAARACSSNGALSAFAAALSWKKYSCLVCVLRAPWPKPVSDLLTPQSVSIPTLALQQPQ